MELCPYRPPSEAYSMLLRLVRNCNWNKCKFCFMYKGQKFSRRSLDEIKKDIDEYYQIYQKCRQISVSSGMAGDLSSLAHQYQIPWLINGDPETAFLGDSDPLSNKHDIVKSTIIYLKEKFPSINRITAYARSKTLKRKTPEELSSLKEAGLVRIHVGLESGDSDVLNLITKGSTPDEHIEAGLKVKESGLSLSFYVIIGIGGKHHWESHAKNTARVINAVNPDFIRIRTLYIDKISPLNELVEIGEFVQSNPEEMLLEQKLLLQNLSCSSMFVSDHVTNILNLQGNLGQENIKIEMINQIDEILNLPEDTKNQLFVRQKLAHL